jgi:SRSO17 transposase
MSAPILECPPSGQPPTGHLAPRDTEPWAEAVVASHRAYADVSKRRAQRDWAECSRRGQRSDLARQTVEPRVLAVPGPAASTVRAVPQFLGAGAWDAAAWRERREPWGAQARGQPDGGRIGAGSGVPQQGPYSVGVARQDCGVVGQIAHGPHGVLVASARRPGSPCVARRLSLPEAWCREADAAKRARCGVPPAVVWQPAPALALERGKGVTERGHVPWPWGRADAHYGMHPAFLEGVAALGHGSCAAVPTTPGVGPEVGERLPPSPGPRGAPGPGLRVAPGTSPAHAGQPLGAPLPADAWRSYTRKAGSTGASTAACAVLRATRQRGRRPGHPVWLIVRRGLAPGAEVQYSVRNAPATGPHTTLVRRRGRRGPVETALEEGQTALGMAHDETRTWRGWHHHMPRTFLAPHGLWRLRLP